nr:uncharacterized protein LOC109159798 [Ipomoea batatas]
MKAGIRRPPKPVGAKWLLADLPTEAVCVPSTPAIPVSSPIQSENNIIMHGELKRRREGVLGTRGVETTGECCLCEAAAETIEHLFCNCPVVSQLWNGFEEFLGGTLVSVLERFLGSTIPFKAIEMAARLWVIWSARNDKLWNAKVCNFDDLLRTVDIYVSSWTQAYVLPPGLMSVAPNTVVNVWCVPPFGYLKCNVDASLAGDVSGFGAVIRDHAGRKQVFYFSNFSISLERLLISLQASNSHDISTCAFTKKGNSHKRNAITDQQDDKEKENEHNLIILGIWLEMIGTISIHEEYMKTFEILSKDLKFAEGVPMVKSSKALKDVQPELEKLRQKSISKVFYVLQAMRM